MKQLGKKGQEWENAKKELRPEFDRLGIHYCEFRGRGCTGGGDTFAHVLRRRHLGRSGSDIRYYNLRNVMLSCIVCHDYLDVKLTEKFGGREIQRIIDARNEKFLFEDL